MSLLFGKGQKSKPQFTSLAVQTSTSAIGIAIGFGKNRSSHNLIWQGDFKSVKNNQKSGKGGPSNTSYTYTGSFIMALGWGVVSNVLRVWKDQSEITGFTQLGFTLFDGETPQSPWGYLTSNHPSESLGYPGIAYLAVANYDLGQGNSLPQHSFEIEWPLAGTQVGGNGDADPALVFEEFLTNESFGVGFDFSVFNQDTVFSGPDATGEGDSSYQTYCRAIGFGISPVLSSQEAAKETLERWARITNTAIVWNGYELKLRPYGSEPITGNGVTYIPEFPIRYTLTDDDFLRSDGGDPIVFERVDPADAKNGFSLVISNRDNQYNDLPVHWRDQGLIDQYGYRKSDPLDAKEVCDPEMAATMVALIGQRIAYVRNTFFFSLGPKYSLLEPMDVVEIVDPVLGSMLVLINEFEEEEDGSFRVSAEEYNGETTVTSPASTQPISNTPVNTGVSPGPANPPMVIEVPRSLTESMGTIPEVWVAVSGSTEDWGGCFVWISTNDVSYNRIGEVTEPSRMGVLTADLSDYSGSVPDETNTLSVSLDLSFGEMEDATPDEAESLLTLCWADGELLSYQNADPTGEYDYDLSVLYRGLYGTSAVDHLSGSDFVRLDDTVFKYRIPQQFIGKTVYLKLQSYNRFGGGLEDLSECTAYPYFVAGSSFGSGAGGTPSKVMGLSAVGFAGTIFLTWDVNPANDSVRFYSVYRVNGASGSFGSAVLQTNVSYPSNAYTDVSGTPGETYTYFVVAVNDVGPGEESDPEEGVPGGYSEGGGGPPP